MSLPQLDCNLVGTRIYPVTDLGLVSATLSNTAVNGTAFSTGVPGTVIVMGSLSSGTSCTINIRVDTTAANALANIASPTATLVLNATGTKFYQTVTTTSNASAQMQDRPASDPLFVAPTSSLWVQLQEAPASGGCKFIELMILTLFELIGGEDWYSIRAGGFNAVAGCVGIGATGGPNGQSLTEPLGFQDGTGALTTTNF